MLPDKIEPNSKGASHVFFMHKAISESIVTKIFKMSDIQFLINVDYNHLELIPYWKVLIKNDLV